VNVPYSLGATFYDGIYRTFIRGDRYLFFLEGIGNTVILSLLAIVVGVVIGIMMCLFKTGAPGRFNPLKWFAVAYIDVIRGTPSVVQMLIIYFIIFGRSKLAPIVIAAIAFGVNSGAYVAEIMRAGILSVDVGQTEAGRSLGMSKFQTMRFIVLPQAFKNILPALINEFVVLIKETAIAGYIGIRDLTKAATGIQSKTYDYIYPLISSAVIYYVIIKALTLYMSSLERKLRRSDVR
jgi:His/Glu/Gln/Arg/opine family amino acid ABC transporter permease subunit